MFFELGGVRVPIESVGSFSQSYEPLGGAARLRMMSGALVQQVTWRRLRTTLTGDGWWPSGLETLDYDAPLTLLCAAPRAILSASNVIALPAARRTDAGYTPQGFARVAGSSAASVGGGELVPTAVAIAADVATLTTVAGATGYQIAYWPSLSVLADPPTMEADITGAAHRWTLTADEV